MSFTREINNNNNNRRLVTLSEHTLNHGKQTNSSTKERGRTREIGVRIFKILIIVREKTLGLDMRVALRALL